MFKYLNQVPLSYDQFPYKYIDAEVNNKSDKTKGQLVGYETKKEIRHYVESLNHDPNWLKTELLTNCEYINFFMQIYMQWIKDNGSTSSS